MTTLSTFPSWTADVHRRQLPNGLRVLVQADPTAPAVAVVIHVHAGFFDEPDRWQGISHVLEHMFFKGTPTRGVGQIATETKALGGYLNASAGYDTTSYYVVLPPQGFEQALAIQADALRNAAIDRDELARELRVIIEEAKRKLDTPSSFAYETLHSLLFDQHRIRRWRIGFEETLAGFTREDVAGYYQSRYVPDRVIVSIVGAVDRDRAFQSVERLFGDWPGGVGGVDPSPDEPWRTGVRAKVLRGDVRQAELALGWRGVAPLHDDAPALDLAAMILSAGRGGWLYRALRQPGLVTSIGSYHYSPAEVGVFSITAEMAPALLERSVEEIAAQVARLRDPGPTDADLEHAKTLLTAQWARRLESVDGRATSFAAAEALGGLEVLDAEYRRQMAVDREQVRRVAERYLGPGGVSAVGYLPTGSETAFDSTWLAGVFETAAPAKAEPSPVPVFPPVRPKPASGRTVAGVTHVALSGVDLLIRPKRGASLVTVGIYRHRLVAESALHAGVGALALRSAVRGTKSHDANQLADAIESLGGSLGATLGADWFGVQTSVLAQHRDRAVGLLAAVMTEPRLAEADIGAETATLREEAVQTADDMFRYPVQLALEAAFGARGYGLPVKGTVDSIDRLSPRLVTDWFGVETGRVAVVVAGNVPADEAIAGLAGVVDRIRSGNLSSGIARLRSTWSRKEPLRQETRAKSQTALAMAFPGPTRTSPDRFAVEVLATVASGLGGRLFSALRDQRSLAYTVLMSSWQRAGAGAILTYIATSPEREDEARTAMLTEIGLLVKSGVTQDELDRAISYLSGQVMVQRQTTGAIAAELVDAWMVGKGLEELEDPTAGYRAVTLAAVQAAAERYLVADQRAEGVVRGGGAGSAPPAPPR